jgi:opacity protein-like surface antigen
MFKRCSKIIFIVAMIWPLATLANGYMRSPAKVNNQCDKKADATCGDYPEYTPAYSCHSYSSGLYLGIQGSYVYTVDHAEFEGDNFSNPNYVPKKSINHLNSYGGGAYLGYGYVFDHGFLPYLGAELGFNLRSDYNDDHSSFDDGDIYGKQINSRGGISFDVMPGFFFDDTNTTLVYVRLGIEGDQFQIDSDTDDVGHDYEYRPLVRVGAGIEHEIVNNFYVRADYVASVMVDSIEYSPYLPTYGDTYSSRVWFNTCSIGINYRF